jgi:hypothetical protein
MTTLERFQAKHALGLDPGVGTGSREENASKQETGFGKTSSGLDRDETSMNHHHRERADVIRYLRLQSEGQSCRLLNKCDWRAGSERGQSVLWELAGG